MGVGGAAYCSSTGNCTAATHELHGLDEQTARHSDPAKLRRTYTTHESNCIGSLHRLQASSSEGRGGRRAGAAATGRSRLYLDQRRKGGPACVDVGRKKRMTDGGDCWISGGAMDRDLRWLWEAHRHRRGPAEGSHRAAYGYGTTGRCAARRGRWLGCGGLRDGDREVVGHEWSGGSPGKGTVAGWGCWARRGLQERAASSPGSRSTKRKPRDG